MELANFLLGFGNSLGVALTELCTLRLVVVKALERLVGPFQLLGVSKELGSVLMQLLLVKTCKDFLPVSLDEDLVFTSDFWLLSSVLVVVGVSRTSGLSVLASGGLDTEDLRSLLVKKSWLWALLRVLLKAEVWAGHLGVARGAAGVGNVMASSESESGVWSILLL